MKPTGIWPVQSVKRLLIDPLIDFIYAPVCFHCNDALPAGEYWCTRCDTSLERIQTGSDSHKYLREEILAQSANLRDVYALYEFEPGGVLQTLIHELKYRQKTDIGVKLGKRLGTAVKNIFGVDESWILIPIPLHHAKERERGYNQSYYIARGLHEATGARIATNIIERNRNTRTQTKLSMSERMENVSGAFVRHDSTVLPDEQPVALIDDVIKTGSTMVSIAHLLPENTPVYAFSAGNAPLHVQSLI